MKEQLAERLKQLRAEQEAGQTMLAELDRKRADLSQTLLRISGAIQVLEEMLDGEHEATGLAPDHARSSTPNEALVGEAPGDA